MSPLSSGITLSLFQVPQEKSKKLSHGFTDKSTDFSIREAAGEKWFLGFMATLMYHAFMDLST